MSGEQFESHDEFIYAVMLAREAANAYYHSDALLMTDADYDTLINRIDIAVQSNPGWDDQGVLTKVAAGTSSIGDVSHPEPMLSLAKVTDKDSLEAFLSRLKGGETYTEPKLDGLAVRAEYHDGQLRLVATRGDGFIGEDVTFRALRVKGLPQQLLQAVSLEVRGEIFMTNSDFEVASRNRVQAGKPAFVNPRNATAGTLRNEELSYEAPLSFAAYDASGQFLDEVETHSRRMEIVSSLGVQIAGNLIREVDPHSVPWDAIAVIGEIRDTLEFPIDGAVVKCESLSQRERLGAASRQPRWAIAWKYPPAEAESVLRDIEVTIGRTGRMALTAVIDPVYVSGATVSRATLHNVDFVTTQGLGIGSRVVVIRAGDVIPRVTAAAKNDPEVEIWVAPECCLQCSEPWDKSSVLWRCHSAQCSAAAALAYWASRDCLDIERLGEAVCDALVANGLAQDVADLYSLTLEDLSNLPIGSTPLGGVRVLGVANAEEIIAGLERSKSQSFNRVITGLGIRMTGRSVGRWLAQHFKSMTALRAATVADIAAIEGMGEAKAQSVVDGLHRLASTIDRLEAAGIAMEIVANQEDGRPLDGLTVVVTGAMSGPLAGLSRNEMNEVIDRSGGKASGSVSQKTSLLVCGEEGSTKYLKAQALGVRIVSPEQFAEMIGFSKG